MPLDLTVVLDWSGSLGRPTNVETPETADTTDTYTRWELVARALEGLIDILPEQAQLTIVDFASDVRAINTKDFTHSSVIRNPVLAGEKSQISSYIDAVAPSGETRGDLVFRATFNLFNNATYFAATPRSTPTDLSTARYWCCPTDSRHRYRQRGASISWGSTATYPRFRCRETCPAATHFCVIWRCARGGAVP